jgi:hypothetical protein
MRGEYDHITFKGVNTEVLDDQAPDGFCETIENLRPAGDESNPYWVPIESLGYYAFSHADFAISDIIKFFFFDSSAYVILATVGLEKRLYVIGDSSETYLVVDADDISFAKGSKVWGVISTFLNGEIKETYYVKKKKNDIKIVENIIPEFPAFNLLFVPKYFDPNTADPPGIGVPNGEDTHAPIKTYKILVRATYLTSDGFYISSGEPVLLEIPPFVVLADNWFCRLLPYIKIDGYTQYKAAEVETFHEYIESLSISMTLPNEDMDVVVNDGKFYEIYNKPITSFKTSDAGAVVEEKLSFTTDNLVTKPLVTFDHISNHKIYLSKLYGYNSRTLSTAFSEEYRKPITNNVDYYVNDEAKIRIAYFYNTANTRYEIQFRIEEIADAYDVGTYRADGNPVSGITASNLVNCTTFISGVNFYVYVSNGSTNSSFEIRVDIENLDGTIHKSVYFNWESKVDFKHHFGFSTFSTLYLNKTAYDIIDVETDDGILELKTDNFNIRIWDGAPKETIIPKYLSYSDQRAKRVRRYLSGTEHYLLFDLQLTPHHSLDLAHYSYDNETDDNRDIEYDFVEYFTDGVGVTPIVDDNGTKVLNDKLIISQSYNPFVFDPSTTYQFNDEKIVALAINAKPTSEGQFGQYPLYVFTQRGIYALEQTADPSVIFGRVSPLSTFHYVDSAEKVANAERDVLFLNNTGVYVISGGQIERISDPVKGTGYITDAFLETAKIAYNRLRDEIYIIGSTYTIVYSTRYKMWYKRNESFRSYFYDYPRLYALDGNVIRDYSVDTGGMIDYVLKTRPFRFKNPFWLKKWLYSVLRCTIGQGLGTVILYGNGVQLLYHSMYGVDKEVYSPYGAMREYKLTIDGSGTTTDTIIHLLEVNYEIRYPSRVRK